MNGLLDILFFAVVAVFILMRLRNVLGQKTGEDAKRRAEKQKRARAAKQVGPKVVDFPNKKKEGDIPLPAGDMKVVSPPVAEGMDAKVAETVNAITAIDRGFTLSWFMAGARRAFEMIVESFSKGDEKTLKTLLSKEVFQQFQDELKAQKEKKQKQEITLVSVLDASIQDASIQKNTASFTVKFISEQIRVTRDMETGKILEGNASNIDRVEDIWVFTRNLRSSNPNWQLAGT